MSNRVKDQLEVFTGNSNPALAILAGAAIVVMAIALDRVTEAIAERTDPAKRHLAGGARQRARLATGAVVAAVGATALVASHRSGTRLQIFWAARVPTQFDALPAGEMDPPMSGSRIAKQGPLTGQGGTIRLSGTNNRAEST